MGNEITTLANQNRLAEKLKDPTTAARLEKEFKKDGSYYNYLLTKLQAENTCSSPFISISRYQQEQCAELQIKVLMMKVDAYNKTEGAAEFLEKFSK